MSIFTISNILLTSPKQYALTIRADNLVKAYRPMRARFIKYLILIRAHEPSEKYNYANSTRQ